MESDTCPGPPLSYVEWCSECKSVAELLHSVRQSSPAEDLRDSFDYLSSRCSFSEYGLRATKQLWSAGGHGSSGISATLPGSKMGTLVVEHNMGFHAPLQSRGGTEGESEDELSSSVPLYFHGTASFSSTSFSSRDDDYERTVQRLRHRARSRAAAAATAAHEPSTTDRHPSFGSSSLIGSASLNHHRQAQELLRHQESQAASRKLTVASVASAASASTGEHQTPSLSSAGGAAGMTRTSEQPAPGSAHAAAGNGAMSVVHRSISRLTVLLLRLRHDNRLSTSANGKLYESQTVLQRARVYREGQLHLRRLGVAVEDQRRRRSSTTRSGGGGAATVGDREDGAASWSALVAPPTASGMSSALIQNDALRQRKADAEGFVPLNLFTATTTAGVSAYSTSQASRPLLQWEQAMAYQRRALLLHESADYHVASSLLLGAAMEHHRLHGPIVLPSLATAAPLHEMQSVDFLRWCFDQADGNAAPMLRTSSSSGGMLLDRGIANRLRGCHLLLHHWAENTLDAEELHLPLSLAKEFAASASAKSLTSTNACTPAIWASLVELAHLLDEELQCPAQSLLIWELSASLLLYRREDISVVQSTPVNSTASATPVAPPPLTHSTSQQLSRLFYGCGFVHGCTDAGNSSDMSSSATAAEACIVYPIPHTLPLLLHSLRSALLISTRLQLHEQGRLFAEAALYMLQQSSRVAKDASAETTFYQATGLTPPSSNPSLAVDDWSLKQHYPHVLFFTVARWILALLLQQQHQCEASFASFSAERESDDLPELQCMAALLRGVRDDPSDSQTQQVSTSEPEKFSSSGSNASSPLKFLRSNGYLRLKQKYASRQTAAAPRLKEMSSEASPADTVQLVDTEVAGGKSSGPPRRFGDDDLDPDGCGCTATSVLLLRLQLIALARLARALRAPLVSVAASSRVPFCGHRAPLRDATAYAEVKVALDSAINDVEQTLLKLGSRGRCIPLLLSQLRQSLYFPPALQ